MYQIDVQGMTKSHKGHINVATTSIIYEPKAHWAQETMLQTRVLRGATSSPQATQKGPKPGFGGRQWVLFSRSLQET